MLALLLLIPLGADLHRPGAAPPGAALDRLHRLIYLIAILGVWHFWWQVKKDIREPLLYACGLSLLLGYRLWKQRRSPSRLSAARLAGTDGA